MCFLCRIPLCPHVHVLLSSALPGTVCVLWDQRCHQGLLLLQERDTGFPTQRDRRCDSSVEIRLWWGGKAGFNSDLKLQHSSQLLPWSLCCWRCITALRVSKTEQFHFTLSWEIQGSLDFFYFRGKGQTNLNLSILHLQPTKSPSYLLWLGPDLLSPRCICKTVP